MPTGRPIAICYLLIAFFSSFAFAQKTAWNFAVSGDSRNCGDVVMPAVAAGAQRHHAEFYWHLGDLRAIYAPDEDYLHEPEHRGHPPDINQYWSEAWDDYIKNQLAFFGQMPVYVGIGNHETYKPKSRAEFVSKFAPWLDSPVLKKQREADNPGDQTPHSYFHWIQGGVHFIYLDNATPDQFDPAQIAWFEDVLKGARANNEVRSIIVGMHAALPDSLALGHSMSDNPVSTQSGRQVYSDLLKFKQETGKHVYILASHSHFFMSGIFDDEYWRAHGGVLPGWIIGTGGAMRYPLPPEAVHAKEAKQKTYGYLLGTVHKDGSIDFSFHVIKRQDIPKAISDRYTPEFADYCFNDNMRPTAPAAPPAP